MMTRRLFYLLTCLIFLFSCNSNSATDKASTQDSKTTSSQENDNAIDKNLSGTHGIFSYTVNGKHIDARNYVQQSNLFINEVSNDAANGMLKIEVTTNSSTVFNFKIANSGTTSINNSTPSPSGNLDKETKEASYMDGKTYRNHYAVSVTITISSIDANRVKGTFSGTYKADDQDGGDTVTITDGSFDLPFEKN
ncbi:MAG: hypothetical protein JST71_02715 [Bacteroidetes bacterium]|nr:hypothetical protein [Bacteroidota bacterium]